MQDPIKRQKLYNFLKDNNLVSSDFETFSNKYKSEESTSQLHQFLSDNKLTDKSQADFHSEYFGDLMAVKNENPHATPGESAQERNHRLLKENVSSYNDLYSDFKQKTSLTEEDTNAIESGLEKDINKEGIWNTIKDGAKKWWNGVFSDEPGVQVSTDPLADAKEKAQKKLSEQGVKEVTPELLTQTAKEIEIEKRKNSLIDSKKRTYLKEISESDKDLLQAYENFEVKSFSRKDKELIQEQTILRKALEEKASELSELNNTAKQYKENNEPIPKELVATYTEKLNKFNEATKIAQEQYLQYANNREELGSAQDNLDLFKRDYDWSTNFIGNVRASTADILGGLAGGIAYVNDFSEIARTGINTDDILSKKMLNISNYFKEDAEKIRGGIMRPISVDNINNMSDFGSWLSNTAVAQQLPILATISTGAGGIGALGLSSTGQKYSEMQNEGGYSTAQLMGVPLAFGTLDTAGAIVDASIFKSAGRVLRSATDTEKRLIARGMFDRIKETTLKAGKDISKGTLSESAEEGGVQFFQNILDKYALGKQDVVLTDGIKDAMAAGSVFGFGMPMGSHIVKNAYQPFAKSKDFNHVISQIEILENQLNNRETVLPEQVKSALENKLAKKKTQLEGIAKTISEDVSKLSNEAYDKIVGLEREKSAIKEDAKAIKEDNSIDDKVKEMLLSDFKKDFEAIEAQQKGLLEQSTDTKKPEGVSDKIWQQNKDEASKILVAEKQKAGEKEFTITDAEISEKANELLNEQAKQENTVQETKPEVLPVETSKVEENKVNEEVDKQEENVNPQVDNETQTQGDTTINQDVRLSTDTNEGQGQNNEVQSATNIEADTKPIEIKESKPQIIKLSEKGKEYHVKNENGFVSITDKDGKKPSEPTERKVLRKYAKNTDLTKGDKFTPPENVTENDIENIDQAVIENSKNPAEVAEIALRTKTKEFIEENSDSDAIEIIEYIYGNVKRGKKDDKGNDGSFVNQEGEEHITQSIAKTYLNVNGRGLDVLAQELSEQMGREITMQDIIDVIKQYPNGVNDVKKIARNTSKDAMNRFTELTGLPATDFILEEAVNQSTAKEKLNQEIYENYLNYLTFEELSALELEHENFKEYEKTSNKRNDSSKEARHTTKSKTESGVREISDSKNERKEANKVSEQLQKTIDALDQFEKDVNEFFKGNTTAVFIPPPVILGAIKAMKLAVKTAKVGSDIIQAGIDYIKNSDWYKNQITDEKKVKIDEALANQDNFFNSMSTVLDEVKQVEKAKSDLRAQRLKDTTKKLRKQHSELSDYKKALIQYINDKLDAHSFKENTKNNILSLVKKISGVKTLKAADKLVGEIDFKIAKATYKASKRKVDDILKTPKRFLKSVNGKPKANLVDNDTRKLFDLIAENKSKKLVELQKQKAELEQEINNGDVSEKTLNKLIATEASIGIAEAQELLNITKENTKDFEANAERLQLAKTYLDNAFNDFDTFLNEGKYKLKEQIKAEANRLKEINDEFIDATNHKWNDTHENTEKRNALFKKKNNFFNKQFDKLKKVKNWFTRPVTNSFEFLLGFVDQKNNHGEGAVYNRFYKEGIVESDANYKKDKRAIREEVKAELKKILGVNLEWLYNLDRHENKIQKVKDTKIQLLVNGVRETHSQQMSISQALYVHLVSKMPDAKLKLAEQGWDAVALEQLDAFLGEKFLKVSDFMTSYLRGKYDKYNTTFNDLLRTDLGFEEGYFPLKYIDADLRMDVDLAGNNYSLPSVSNGHLKNKVANKNRIDTQVDAFSVFSEYLDSMERFHHYGRFTKDLNAALSNKTVRNNIKTLDETLFSDFKKLSKAVIGDTSEITSGKTEKAIYRANSVLAAGYIGYKGYTALKQFLSMPAYTENANDINIGFNGNKIRIPFVGKLWFGTKMLVNLNPYSVIKSYKFLKKNSPHFYDRIDKGSIGDEFIDNLLSKNQTSFYNKVFKYLVKKGITPNKFIDAITISTGGKVFYDQQFDNYTKAGLDKAEAHRKAIRDFEISFKLTQQSSDASDLSIIQHSKGVLTSLFVPFKNSQFSYFRRISANSNNILRRYKNEKSRLLKLGRKENIASLKALQKIASEGQTFKDLENILLYTHVLPLLWQYVASGLPGLLTDWEDDDTDEMIRAGALGLFDGVFILSDATKWAYNSAFLDKNWNYETSILMSEFQTIFNDVKKVYKEAGEFNEDLLLEIGKGYLKTKSINTETIKNIYDGASEMIMEGDFSQENLMTLLNAPKELRKEEKKENTGYKSIR